MKSEEFMSGSSHVAQQAFDLALPVVEEMGLELVDAEYKKEGSSYYLRLFIDKKGGISIEDCENVSRAADPVISGQLHESFDYFEVSSPGLTRPLVTPSDYIRHEGEEVELKFYAAAEGKKRLTGVILKALAEKVIIESADGAIDVPYVQIASAKRTIKF